jgi:hypothetical protein
MPGVAAPSRSVARLPDSYPQSGAGRRYSRKERIWLW